MLEESAMDMESILKKAVDISPDCVGIINSKDVVIYCNDTFASVFGLTKEAIIGKTNKALLHSAWSTKKGIIIDTEDFEKWYQNIDKQHENKTLNQFETDLTDGRWFKMTRVNLANGYIMFSGIDITDLKQTQASLREANQYIEELAHTDQLTGINNRRAFNLLAEQELNKAKRYHQPLSLLLLDLDYFKKINDNYGHDSGDYVLQKFAEVCKACLRKSDTLARIGGEEFTVLLPMTSAAGAYQIAEKIRITVAEHDFYIKKLDYSVKISVSIGISSRTDEEKEPSVKKLLSQADTALYIAKQNGRDKVVAYPLTTPL